MASTAGYQKIQLAIAKGQETDALQRIVNFWNQCAWATTEIADVSVSAEAAGSSTLWARADHVHKLNTTDIDLGDLGDVTITAKVEGDYLRVNNADTWVDVTIAQIITDLSLDDIIGGSGVDVTDGTATIIGGNATLDLGDLTENWDAAGYQIRALQFYADGSTTAGGFIANTCNLYESSANVWKTDDAFHSAVEFRVTGDTSFSASEGPKLQKLAAHGAVLQGVAGSTNDLLLTTPGGIQLLANPTGTSDLVMVGQLKATQAGAGGGILIGADFQIYRSAANKGTIPTGDYLGIGIIPVAHLHILPDAVGSTSIGGVNIHLGAYLGITSGRSGFIHQVLNDSLNSAGDNAAFLALFPFDDSGTSDDGQWKAFRLKTESSLVDKFWVNKYGAGYFAGDLTVEGVFHGGGAADYTEVEADGDVNFVGGGGMQFGEISAEGNTDETAIGEAGAAVQVAIFDTDGPANGNVTPDQSNHHITVGVEGHYLVMVSATVNSVAGGGSRFEMTVKKNGGTVGPIIPHCDRNLAGGGGQSGVISMSGIADLAAADTVEVWIENETGTENYIVEDISLDVMQVGGT